MTTNTKPPPLDYRRPVASVVVLANSVSGGCIGCGAVRMADFARERAAGRYSPTESKS